MRSIKEGPWVFDTCILADLNLNLILNRELVECASNLLMLFIDSNMERRDSEW